MAAPQATDAPVAATADDQTEQHCIAAARDSGSRRGNGGRGRVPEEALERGSDREPDDPAGARIFVGEWDEEGVYFYQAYNHEIANWAVEHQRFGGPLFNPTRMTWIKPSFAWMLYRCGYGEKRNQERVLKVKLPHDIVARVLSRCRCQHGGGGTQGRVQWDPARDLMSGDGKNPRKVAGQRAIQIGMRGYLSQLYVDSVISIQDVSELAQRIGAAHASGNPDTMAALAPELPDERPYVPKCAEEILQRLGIVQS